MSWWKRQKCSCDQDTPRRQHSAQRDVPGHSSTGVFPFHTHLSPLQRLHLLPAVPSFSQSSQKLLLLHPPSGNLVGRERRIRDRHGEEKPIGMAFPACPPSGNPPRHGDAARPHHHRPAGPPSLSQASFLCTHRVGSGSFPSGSQGSGSFPRLLAGALSLRTHPQHRMGWISHLSGFFSPPPPACIYRAD